MLGEFYGWRSWKVQKLGTMVRLQSLGTGAPHYGCVWTPGRMMEALCDCNNGRHAGTECHASRVNGGDGRVAGEGCSCGFYSAASRDHLMSLPYPSYKNANANLRIFGKVALAGKVIPGTQGWRSQYCWPVELFVPYERQDLVKVLADTYHVPVSLANVFSEKGWCS